MRLHTIKLSGFKSFAEPTAFGLPGQLVGVVGPNGCGKSNIMDAVRWVLGESKASELRGETMQDVIFNGSALRKPASRASVELVFDNARQRVPGAWGRYAEISVRRVLTRDGASSYHINQQPVRRRDVHDLFLGTGLGPRAYAIIGQGTIGRIIESRPEELRLFLEEAAGVSKYKERRRETAARLLDARANLSRVQDILTELQTHRSKLEQQAAQAQRYRDLQARLQRRQQQLAWLKLSQAEADGAQSQALEQQVQLELDAQSAALRHLEAELEAMRQAHYAAGEALNQAQGALYAAAAEVARLEGEIRHLRDTRQRVQQRVQQVQQQRLQWEGRARAAAEEQARLGPQEQAAAEQAAALTAQCQQQGAALPAVQAAVQAAQQQLVRARRALSERQQALGVLGAQQRATEQQRQQWQQRAQRLHGEAQALAVQAADEARLAPLQAEWEQAQQRQQQAQEWLQQLQLEQADGERQRRQCQQQAQAQGQALAQCQARLDALQALQARLQQAGQLPQWLARQGLQGHAALWQRLRPAPGWATAIEAALRERVQALELPNLEAALALADADPPAALVLFALPGGEANAAQRANAAPALQPLAQHLHCPEPALQALLARWLSPCWAAASLPEALAARATLGRSELIYTPQGHSVGAQHLAFYAAAPEQSGWLERAQEIGQLQQQLRGLQGLAEQARQAQAGAEAACSQTSQRLQQARAQASAAQAQAHALQVELLRLSQQAEHRQQRAAQLAQERAEAEQHVQQLQVQQQHVQAQQQALQAELAGQQQAQQQAEAEQTRAEHALQQASAQARALERQAQEAEFARRSLQARADELQRNQAEAAQHGAELAGQAQQALTELDALSDAAAQAALQVALAARHRCEQELGARRSAHDGLSADLRASDARRLQTEHGLAPLRARLSEQQLRLQAAQLSQQQQRQSLEEAGVDVHDGQVLQALARSVEADGVQLASLPAQVQRSQRELEALGDVNLAALQELAVAQQRLQFLGAQSHDLQQAIDTLEGAIRTIDIETRSLLGQTFEAVNGQFGRIFPELFGGGRAQLQWSEGEILEAGVQVLAQPPGKKNQTIHLLSGGEKALTAIALVFAIFHLNPAPFCLLDEVDAPLDDANTERYAKLVTRMSSETQFLFISHNKITMEMAQQLIGVTMQEQGVSRIVAVDLQSAHDLLEVQA
ncbi:chromosome segregation protein SMC [Serpentinimonas barnesii]|uniref:chromosome segregation protein SMC n=1 Tax=Serpentinimonas barnesii TaxID=1458427 RepID=UPI0004962426|nr:chromosome segregation protein SMC [Serpentinimonas barnesii]